MAESFRLEIVTPEGVFTQTDAAELVGPGWEGEFGVRPGHRSMVMALKPGVVRYTPAAGGLEKVAIAGGFAVIDPESARVLADSAEHGREVDVAAAREAVQAAEVALREATFGSDEAERATKALAAAQARLDASGN